VSCGVSLSGKTDVGMNLCIKRSWKGIPANNDGESVKFLVSWGINRIMLLSSLREQSKSTMSK
jgi:hypothetical protein